MGYNETLVICNFIAGGSKKCQLDLWLLLQ